MFDCLQAMLVKELLELRRDRWALFRLLVPMFIQVLVFGYAATFTVNSVSTAVLDLDHSQASRALVSHFAATRPLPPGRQCHDTKCRSRRTSTPGGATVAIVIHAGFARSI